ncbi:MAG: hypothetical protein HYR80_02420 [Nitrospirae bacterium]|nr:hypothetical protein [Nitrospirota bacterium]
MRIYPDTSVFGGCFDDKFSIASNQLFNEVRKGKWKLIISPIVAIEIKDAPEQVRSILNNLHNSHYELCQVTKEMELLKDRYLKEGVVGEGSEDDAFHVAIATISGAEMILSWNFKHIVHYDKIKKYNAVNHKNGYGTIQIYSPLEVVEL